eukprot:2349734-Pyramimonas_sp.AAC.1
MEACHMAPDGKGDWRGRFWAPLSTRARCSDWSRKIFQGPDLIEAEAWVGIFWELSLPVSRLPGGA